MIDVIEGGNLNQSTSRQAVDVDMDEHESIQIGAVDCLLAVRGTVCVWLCVRALTEST